MGYLQLAEMDYSMLAENPKENYIFIPAGYAGASKDMHVREDYFDNLSNAEYMAMIQELAPFQSQGLSAIGIGAVAGGALNVAKNLISRRRARVAAGTAKPLFKPGGLVSRIGAKLKGQQAAPGTDLMPVQMDPRTGGVQIGGTIDIGGAEQIIPEETVFQKNKNLLLIGGAVAAAGIIFLVTRKKTR